MRRFNRRQKRGKQEQLKYLMSNNVPMTNLDQFMKHTTPIVTAQHFPKTGIKGWRNHDEYYHPYFVLGDLWESLKEWSAYGAGVPLVLKERHSVIQYYVPYLSAIQLYVDPSTPLTTITRSGEESESDSSRASSSDGNYEPHAPENNIKNPPGLLMFEYFEHALPFHRAPLTDKVSHIQNTCWSISPEC